MPYADCPTCNAEVKYPRGADEGTEVTCPDCDEVFVPPALMPKSTTKTKKPYSVEDEEVYEAKGPIADPDKARKKRHAAAAAHHAREQRRREARGAKRELFGTFDYIFLGLLAAFTVIMPVAFTIARRSPSAAQTMIVVFIYAAAAILFFVKLTRTKSRLGG